MTNDDFRSKDDSNLSSRAGDDDRVMPLGVGDFDATGDEFALGGEQKKKVSSGTLLIIGVVLLAGIGLYSMRSLAIAMASAERDESLETKVESFIESLPAGTVVDSTDRMPGGEVLVNDRTEKQVALTDVQKNPFVSWLPAVQTNSDEPPIDPTDPNAAREQRRRDARDRFNDAAANFRLVMVMGGSNPMANINGRIVHEGDEILEERSGIRFKVEEIDAAYVIVAGSDAALDLHHQIVLRMNEGGL